MTRGLFISVAAEILVSVTGPDICKGQKTKYKTDYTVLFRYFKKRDEYISWLDKLELSIS
jgi:hypothetical protein